MHHNSHIFEPEALMGTKWPARRFSSASPRSCVVVQGLAGSGKSSVANAILSTPCFPYFSRFSTYGESCKFVPKPSVVVTCSGLSNSPTVQSSLPSLADVSCARESPASVDLFTSPMKSSTSYMCRSLSETLYRESWAPQQACGAVDGHAHSSGDITPRVAPVISMLMRLSSGTSNAPQIALDSQLAQSITDWSRDTDEEGNHITFARVQLRSASCGNHSSSQNASAEFSERNVTIVESQVLEDRPALHLVHSVVYVMSADEACPALRTSRRSSIDWTERNSALVASMSAVTTCDGDRCKSCLVVNLGHLLDVEDPGDFVVVEKQVAESCHFEGEALEGLRQEMSRRWRLDPRNIFFFSAQRVIAQKLMSVFDNSQTWVTSTDAAEFTRFVTFLERNFERGHAEWFLERRDKRTGTLRSACSKEKEEEEVVKRCLSPSTDDTSTSVFVAPQDDVKVLGPLIEERTLREAAAERAVVERNTARERELAAALAELQLAQDEVAMRVARRSQTTWTPK